MSSTILIVDDEQDIRRSLGTMLRNAHYRVTTAESGAEAQEVLATSQPEVAIVDLRMPRGSGDELLDHIVRNHSDTAVIILTGYGSIHGAVDAMKRGAADYLTKPPVPDDLLLTVARVLETRRLARENVRLREQVARLSPQTALVGGSRAMQALRELIRKVAPSDLAVLIRGETGVGKELVARAIHEESSRAEAPSLAVSCAALPDELFESELFGYEKGAFTDAQKQKLGLFEMAHQGTLFLDEVGAMPPALQAKFLRVLEEKTFRRLGGTQRVEVDVRILSATNQDLLAGASPFREDLYHRLRQFEIVVPPLRERKEDLPALIATFLAAARQTTHKQVEGIASGTLSWLQEYGWPGNVRELQNAIHAAVVLTEGPGLVPQDFPFLLVDRPVPLGGASLKQVEVEQIRLVLASTEGNKSEAARRLGIDRATLARKVKEYAIETP